MAEGATREQKGRKSRVPMPWGSVDYLCPPRQQPDFPPLPSWRVRALVRDCDRLHAAAPYRHET